MLVPLYFGGFAVREKRGDVGLEVSDVGTEDLVFLFLAGAVDPEHFEEVVAEGWEVYAADLAHCH